MLAWFNYKPYSSTHSCQYMGPKITIVLERKSFQFTGIAIIASCTPQLGWDSYHQFACTIISGIRSH